MGRAILSSKGGAYMKQKELSILIRIVLALGAVCTLFLAAVFVPELGKDIAWEFPNLARAYWPCLIFFWVTAAVVLAFLAVAWLIARDIGRDKSFTLINAKRLGVCSLLALTDTLMYIIAGIVLMSLNLLHISLFMLGVLICAVGAAVTVCCAALSHLTRKAADMQDENDLTV